MTLASQKKYFVRTVLLVLAFAILGCGQPADEPSSEVKHILLPPNEVGLTRRIHEEAIDVCLTNGGENIIRRFISESIHEWLMPMREINPRVTNIVRFTCPGHVDITINSGQGRAHTYLNRYPAIYIYEEDPYLPYKILHEIGHAFGLDDTYEAQGGTCMSEQDSSVMCHANSRFLQEDDIEGARNLFMRTWGFFAPIED